MCKGLDWTDRKDESKKVALLTVEGSSLSYESVKCL